MVRSAMIGAPVRRGDVLAQQVQVGQRGKLSARSRHSGRHRLSLSLAFALIIMAIVYALLQVLMPA